VITTLLVNKKWITYSYVDLTPIKIIYLTNTIKSHRQVNDFEP